MSAERDHSRTAILDSPRRRYEAALEAGDLVSDAAQAAAIDQVERLYRAFSARDERSGVFARILGMLGETPEFVRGLYLWGSVGRGKTYIVDSFYDCVPTERKLRIHFHSFMRKIHDELRRCRDERNPLEVVADRWCARLRLLCLDEFHVGDITDAMLLAKLLGALFERGVTLVATSNEAPDQLYRGGLQRDRFVPAIAVIKAHTVVLELAGETDYRLRALEQAEVYHVPLDANADVSLARSFARLALEPGREGSGIDIEGRTIATRRMADGIIWCDFDVLCGGPRSSNDYIEIARCHHTVMISGIPVLHEDDNDAARRFINLIDEFYDRNVKVVISAAAGPDGLYRGQRLRSLFRRTVSRLKEMQSHDYLASPHLCD